ncbi:MAG: STAS domain-containing protein [Polyangiaceae bacterium]|nr:STAS domain-containing protein [Polyangiaceae bacterium]
MSGDPDRPTDARELQEELAALRGRLAEAERALEEERRAAAAARAEGDLLRDALEAMPIGVVIMEPPARAALVNAAARSVLGDGRGPDGWWPTRPVFLPDGVTPAAPERAAAMRGIRGESTDGQESILRDPDAPGKETWITADGRPLRGPDGAVRGAVAVIRDVTEHKQIVGELDEAVAANEAEKRDLIARLRAAVEELSTPVVEVWDDVLALPVIGELDARRTADMTARLLDEITRTGARYVIVDWTGVEIVDSHAAARLLHLIRAVGLVGAECVVTGIRPALAQSLQAFDTGFGGVRTLRTLKHGLRYCLSRRDARPAAGG